MHSEEFWSLIQQIINDLKPDTGYVILIHPRSMNGYVTLGPSRLIDSQTRMELFRSIYESLFNKIEQDYEEDFCYETKVMLKEVGAIGTEPGQLPTSIPSPTPQTSVDKLDLIIKELKKQNRRAQGYERLAESIANALDRLLSPTPFSTDPFITPPAAYASNTTPLASQLKTRTSITTQQDRALDTMASSITRLTNTVDTLTQTVTQQGKT
jgi:hypothetical protein